VRRRWRNKQGNLAGWPPLVGRCAWLAEQERRWAGTGKAVERAPDAAKAYLSAVCSSEAWLVDPVSFERSLIDDCCISVKTEFLPGFAQVGPPSTRRRASGSAVDAEERARCRCKKERERGSWEFSAFYGFPIFYVLVLVSLHRFKKEERKKRELEESGGKRRDAGLGACP